MKTKKMMNKIALITEFRTSLITLEMVEIIMIERLLFLMWSPAHLNPW